MSFLSVDHVSAEDHFFTIAAAYDTGETLCTTEARCNAETNFRLTEFSVFSSITEVASASEFAAAAESVAVDSSDDRLGQVFNASEGILGNFTEFTAFDRVLGGHFDDVSASYEGFSTFTSDDNNFDRFVSFDFTNAIIQFRNCFRIQCVESLRAADR